jgi:diguanylate cyclase (GGDEF)-like protein
MLHPQGFTPADQPPRNRRSKRQQIRLRTLAFVFLSYAIDAMLLGLFAWAGTIPFTVAVAYFVTGVTVCSGFFLLIGSGFSERFRDGNLTLTQMAAAVAVQIAFIIYAPDLAFVFLNVLFVICTVSSLRLTLAHSAAAWGMIAAATALVLGILPERLDLPRSTPSETVLVWLSYMLAIARTTYVGIYGSNLRLNLLQRSNDLADSFRRVEQLAIRDELTGTLNRRSIVALVVEAVRAAREMHQPFSVVMLDLDNFKAVNDRFGHHAGDLALQRFVEIVEGRLRDTDRLGRYGGEEFLLLLQATRSRPAFLVMERIRAAVADGEWSVVGPGAGLTVSAGIADYRRGDAVTDLIRRADAALYLAKGLGRNRVILAERS